ncbi:MAG TPA: hypothetical protein VEC36_13485 [Patescibacteria group bacterium]|nr:hypothetical protein [Patescibacteria group bacterium]
MVLAFISFLFGTWWFVLYFFLTPQIDANMLVSKQIRFDSVTTIKRKGNLTDLKLFHGQDVYFLSRQYWWKLYSDEMVINSFKSEKNAVVWLENNDQQNIIAVQNKTISLNPLDGVKSENKNRQMLVFLGIFCLGMSIYAFFKSR